MSQPELEHAKRYAVEATKLFLLDYYKKHYPHYFGNVTMTTRPATRRDYYVPPNLADRCIVVEKMTFDEVGCQRLACFPYKRDLAFCEPHDPPHWLQIGNHFTVACAPSCREQTHSLDTAWRNGKCVQVNPLKKMLALFPEQLFERTSRHPLHGGLDVVDDALRLNETYCLAYGLDLEGDDCAASTAQWVGEFFIGSTAYRAIKKAGVPSWEKTPPAQLPDYLNYRPPAKRKKRSYDGAEDPSVAEVFREIAVDIAFDTAVDVTVDTVAAILKKKVPRLLTRSLDSIAVKTVLQDLVKKFAIREFSRASLLVGKALSTVSSVYAVYGVVMVVLDTIDPFEYNKVLNRYALAEIDRNLDAQHFGELGRFPEITPEDVWDGDVLDEDDESERYAFMSERMQEYLDALYKLPAAGGQPDPAPVWSRYVPERDERKEDPWKHWIHGGILFMMMGVMVVYIRWMHVWAACLFFLLVAYRKM